MKIRLSVQPEPKEHKSIVPSHLLSDPAFSPDPHLNPYFATDQELAWTPPQGHPTLKHKNRGPVANANFAFRNDIIASVDFDFQLLQPPNSPVSYIGGSGVQEPSSFPFSSTLKSSARKDSPALNAAASFAPPIPPSSLDTRPIPPGVKSAVATVVSPQPPAAKPAKKKRMPFLSRRKSQLSSPNPPNAPARSTTKIVSLNDVTRPTAPRLMSEPVPATTLAKRPFFPPRSATIGTETPRSTGSSSLSAITKRNGLKDLDRIDELDETSPWGISLHHGGPYEAAVQALRRAEPADTLSSGTTLVNEYHTQYGQPYVPPAPATISLNLSPGQILPRNFGEQRPSHPRPREISALPPRMQQAHPQPHPALSRSLSHAVSSQGSVIPPRHMNRMKAPQDGQSEPLRYRRQSQPVSPTSSAFFPQLLNPHTDSHLEPRADTRQDLTFSRRRPQTYQPLVNPHPLIVPDSTSQQTNIPQSAHDYQKDYQNIPNTSRRQSRFSAFTLVDSISQPQTTFRPESPTVEEPENASDQPHNEDVSFNIGLAMLQPEDSSEISIATPTIFLPAGTPDQEKDFDPYDPIHLNNEHSRSPSLVALYAPSSRSSHSHESMSSREPSRIPSPDHSIAGSYSELSKDLRGPETHIAHQDAALSKERCDPPPYALVASDDPNSVFVDNRAPPRPPPSHFRYPAQTSTSSRNASPERSPSRKSILSKRSTLSIPSESSHSSHHSHLSHRSRRESPMLQPRPMPQPVQPLQTMTMQDMPSDIQSQRRPTDSLVQPPVRPVSMSMPGKFGQINGPIVRQQSQNVPPMPNAQTAPPVAAPSTERLLSPPPSSYAKSTHQSISTYSSSQLRNGPPANRHLPKRLVMPAPLNNMNSNGLNGYATPPSNRLNTLLQSYPPPRQIPPRQAQVAFQQQTQVYHRSPVYSPSSKPQAAQMPQSQEIHTAAVRKLKKRASMIPPAAAVHIPSAPIISTVSFAPPVIGFGQNVVVDKALSRVKAEKIPKRVLSKRRTDL